MAICIATSSSASDARSSLLSFFRFPMFMTSHHTLEPYQLVLFKIMIDRYQYSALRNTIILYWFLSIATAINTLHHLTRSYCIDFYTSQRIELCATHTTYSDSWRCGQLKTGYCTYVRTVLYFTVKLYANLLYGGIAELRSIAKLHHVQQKSTISYNSGWCYLGCATFRQTQSKEETAQATLEAPQPHLLSAHLMCSTLPPQKQLRLYAPRILTLLMFAQIVSFVTQLLIPHVFWHGRGIGLVAPDGPQHRGTQHCHVGLVLRTPH